MNTRRQIALLISLVMTSGIYGSQTFASSPALRIRPAPTFEAASNQLTRGPSQFEAVSMFQGMNDPRALPFLVQLSNQPGNFEPCWAILAMGKLGDKTIVDSLITRASDPHASCRSHSVAALGELGGDKAADFLLTLVEDSQNKFGLRYDAIEALGTTRDPRALQPLLALIDDAPYQLQALSGLGKLHDAKAVAPLVEYMKSQAPSLATVDFRWGAAQALGEMEDAASLPSLLQAINSPSPGKSQQMLQAFAAAAVPLIKSMDKISSIRSVLENPAAIVKSNLLIGIQEGVLKQGETSFRPFVKDMTQLLNTPGDQSTANLAAQVLGYLGGIDSFNALVASLDVAPPFVVIASAHWIAEFYRAGEIDGDHQMLADSASSLSGKLQQVISRLEKSTDSSAPTALNQVKDALKAVSSF